MKKEVTKAVQKRLDKIIDSRKGKSGNEIAFKNKDIIFALEQSKGFVSRAALLLKCNDSTIFYYIKNHPEIQAALEIIKEKRHDFVEMSMMKRIGEGSDRLIEFYSVTQLRERGYHKTELIESRNYNMNINQNINEITTKDRLELIKEAYRELE